MPFEDDSLTLAIGLDLGRLNRAIQEVDRELADLETRTTRIAARGERIPAALTKELALKNTERRALQARERELQKQLDDLRRASDETGKQARFLGRATRAIQSMERSFRESDANARTILARSASLARNLRDAGPLGIALAGFSFARGIAGGVAQSVGASAATAGVIGGGAAVGAGILAAPTVLGIAGRGSSLASESLDRNLFALSRALEGTGRTALATAQEIKRGASDILTAGQSAKIGFELAEAGITDNLGAIAGAIADIATFENRDASDITERIRRGVLTGRTQALQTVGINVDFEQVYLQAATRLGVEIDNLTEKQKQAARVQDVVNAVLARAAATGNQATGELGAVTRSIKQFETATDDLSVAFGDLIRPFTIDAFNLLTDAVSLATTAVKNFSGRLTEEEQQIVDTINALPQLNLDNLQNLSNDLLRRLFEQQGINVSAAQRQRGRNTQEGVSPEVALARTYIQIRDTFLSLPADIQHALEQAINIGDIGQLRDTIVAARGAGFNVNFPGVNFRSGRGALPVTFDNTELLRAAFVSPPYVSEAERFRQSEALNTRRQEQATQAQTEAFIRRTREDIAATNRQIQRDDMLSRHLRDWERATGENTDALENSTDTIDDFGLGIGDFPNLPLEGPQVGVLTARRGINDIAGLERLIASRDRLQSQVLAEEIRLLQGGGQTPASRDLLAAQQAELETTNQLIQKLQEQLGYTDHLNRLAGQEEQARQANIDSMTRLDNALASVEDTLINVLTGRTSPGEALGQLGTQITEGAWRQALGGLREGARGSSFFRGLFGIQEQVQTTRGGESAAAFTVRRLSEAVAEGNEAAYQSVQYRQSNKPQIDFSPDAKKTLKSVQPPPAQQPSQGGNTYIDTIRNTYVTSSFPSDLVAGQV